MDERTSLTFTLGGQGVHEPGATHDSIVARVRPYLVIILLTVVCLGLNMGISTGQSSSPDLSGDLGYMGYRFMRCMEAWDLPAYVPPPGLDGSGVGSIQTGHLVVWRDTLGAINYMRGIDPDSEGTADFGYDDVVAESDVIAGLYRGPALFVDGVDRSLSYTRCLDESGFLSPTAPGRPASTGVARVVSGGVPGVSSISTYAGVLSAEDLAGIVSYFRVQELSDDLWASCARTTVDPPPGLHDVPGVLTSDTLLVPTVTVLSTITEDQLRRLLAACPIVDPAVVAQRTAWLQTHPYASMFDGPDSLPAPSVVFQISPLEIAYPAGWMPESQLTALIDHLVVLHQVLDEEQDVYSPVPAT